MMFFFLKFRKEGVYKSWGYSDCLRWAGLKTAKTHNAFLNFEDAASLKDVLGSF